jgi:transcriptional regulator with XRE-family HTH domain
VLVPRLYGLRTARLAVPLTQKELAEATGLHPVTISDLERLEADARPDTIRRLAKALGVEPVVLMRRPEQ